MPDYQRELYAGKPETKVYNRSTGRKRIVNTVLLDTWLGVIEDPGTGWLRVKTIGENGWVREADTRTDMGLKLFFIDVGQGDCCLIESPGKRILVDGGPYSNLRNYLTGWKYKWLLENNYPVQFDAVIVSHFDADHFAGLIPVIEDRRFQFGAIYHNGIARFSRRRSQRPAGYDTDLGQTDGHGVLRTTFSTINDAQRLLNGRGLMVKFREFLEAAVQAHNAGRLGRMRRLTYRDGHVPGFAGGSGPIIEVLGPVPESQTGLVRFRWFEDSSHTRNGHSLVLRLTYRNRRTFATVVVAIKVLESISSEFASNCFPGELGSIEAQGAIETRLFRLTSFFGAERCARLRRPQETEATMQRRDMLDKKCTGEMDNISESLVC